MPAYGQRTILLVDDQLIVAHALAKVLQHLPGWTFTHCPHGLEAHAMARRLKPDIILQDLVMPDADGLELLRTYAADPDLVDVAVVVLSNTEDGTVKETAFANGAHDYMVKMPSLPEFRARMVHAANYNDLRREQARLMEKIQSHERELEARIAQLMASEREQVRALDRISRMLSTVTDLDVLMKRLLEEARHLLGCEAGSVLLRDGNQLVFTYAQNDVLNIETRIPDPRRSPVHLAIDRSSIAGAAAVDGLVVVHDAYNIPADAPFRFNDSFDKSTGYRTRAVLALALNDSQGRLLGVLQLLNPRPHGAHQSIHFTDSDQKMARHFAGMAAMALERSQMTRTMILRMIRLAELRDPKETGPHVKRVAEVSGRLFLHWARAHGLSNADTEAQLDLLRTAAMLHDLGKVGIPDVVLKKPGKLDAGERAIMETHPIIGAMSLKDMSSVLDECTRDVILYHQAHWDGSGYPSHQDIRSVAQALGQDPSEAPEPKGESIPLFARLVAVADVFDALMSRRAYKDAWPPERVLETLRQEAGTHFDPELIQLFAEHFDEMCKAHAMFME